LIESGQEQFCSRINPENCYAIQTWNDACFA